MEEQFLQDLRKILQADQIKQKECMAHHTSLHIGGEADYFVTPLKADEIKSVVLLCRQYNIPYYIIGNGSNLLVSDDGYRGMLIKLGDNFSEITITDDGKITAQAGVLLSRLANEAARQGLSGLEFASGIPGTLGGAVAMNAGAYGGEMKQCIISALVMDQTGAILELDNKNLELGYRESILQKKNLCLLNATLQLVKGDRQQIFHKMQELNAQRREKQPLDQYSAGSTFKRPQGYYTGKLIQEAGLKGYQVGGAAVSEKHCGFIINKNNATAKEFMTCIQDVIRIIEDEYEVHLEPEVKFLGEF